MNSSDPNEASGSLDDSRDKWITIDRLCDAYEASLQEGTVERAPFLAGVPQTWREQLTHELDAIDDAYRDAKETREQTMKAPADDVGRRRLPTKTRLAELATLDTDKVWLGRFEIRKRLGTGATGSVWCARDARLARWVALKVPHATRVMSETMASRFQTEARAAAAITHPNVVQVHEVLIEDGLPILIQQWIDGPSLAQYLKDQGPLDCDIAAEWLSQIADAVACAHDSGIVHRDLKPANVMLNRNRPMVLDFGLASYPQFSSGLTTEGTVLGTPAYMSPEQAEGADNGNQPSTDIYALGTILYEMLVGTPPFVGKAREVLQANKTAIPTPPRSRRAGIPRDLETIALRCLAKSPSGRYQSAAELRDDLQRFLRREPIHARKVSALENAWVWCRIHPAYAISAAGFPLVMMLMLGIVVSQLRQNRLSDRANRLVRQKEVGETERQELVVQRRMIELSRASYELSQGDRTRGLQMLRSIPESMRGWEWNLLNLVSHSPSKMINAQVPGLTTEPEVFALALASQRRLLFSATKGGTVMQWAIPGDRELFNKDVSARADFPSPKVLFKHPSPIRALRVSPDERWLCWVDRVGAVTIWDLVENELAQRNVQPQFEFGHTISFSPDSKRLLIGGGSLPDATQPEDQDSWIRAMVLNENQEFVVLRNLQWEDRPAITSMCFVDNNTLVTTRGQSQPSMGPIGYVERFRSTMKTLEYDSLIWRGLSMRGLDFHKGTNQIAWCDDRGMAFVLTLEAKGAPYQPPRQFLASHRGATQVRFAPNGEELVVTTSDGGVSVWFVGKTEPLAQPIQTQPGDGDSKGITNLAQADLPDDRETNPEPTGDPVPAKNEDIAGKVDASNRTENDTKLATVSTRPVTAKPLPVAQHIRDYRGHENTVRDAIFLSPSSRKRNRDLRSIDQRPFVITCGDDGKILQWSNAGHQSIDTLGLDNRKLVDATWLSPRQLAFVTSWGKRPSPTSYRFHSLPRHKIDVDFRHVRSSRSISNSIFNGQTDGSASRPPRFAVCAKDRVQIFETGNILAVASCTLPQLKRGGFQAACLINRRYVLAATYHDFKPPKEKRSQIATPLQRKSKLHLFDLQSDEPTSVLQMELPDLGAVTCLELSPDRSNVCIASENGEVIQLAPPVTGDADRAPTWSKEPVRRWRAHDRSIRDLTWIGDQRLIATASNDGTCAIWDPELIMPLPKHEVAPGEDPQLSEHPAPPVDQRPPVHRLLVSSAPVSGVSVSSTGDRIVTAGADRVIRIWDTESGLEIISLEPRKEPVISAQFGPEDRYLMIAQENSKIEVIELID